MNQCLYILLTKVHTLSRFPQFFSSVLLLCQDPIQDTAIHLVSCLLSLLLPVTVSQTFLDFDDFDHFGYFIECPSIGICLDVFLMVISRNMFSEVKCRSPHITSGVQAITWRCCWCWPWSPGLSFLRCNFILFFFKSLFILYFLEVNCYI